MSFSLEQKIQKLNQYWSRAVEETLAQKQKSESLGKALSEISNPKVEKENLQIWLRCFEGCL